MSIPVEAKINRILKELDQDSTGTIESRRARLIRAVGVTMHGDGQHLPNLVNGLSASEMVISNTASYSQNVPSCH
jgi:hypothetical protein